MRKPHLVHALKCGSLIFADSENENGAYGSGETVCGDTTEYSYVTDEYMRNLPPCKKCFPSAQKKTWGEEYHRRIGRAQAPTIQVKTILTLRSYLA